MIINFNKIREEVLVNFKGGENTFFAKRFPVDGNVMMYNRLEPGASIGMHIHENDCEFIYILEGDGNVLYDDGEEDVHVGECHYCPQGHAHSLRNKGEKELVFFAIVAKQ